MTEISKHTPSGYISKHNFLLSLPKDFFPHFHLIGILDSALYFLFVCVSECVCVGVSTSVYASGDVSALHLLSAPLILGLEYS